MQILGHRPQIDIERISTGEHWYGTRALELGLIDEIHTSDDFLSEAATESDLYGLTFKRKKTLPERLLGGAESLLSR